MKQKLILISIALIFGLFTCAQAQTGCRIRAEIKNFNSDSLWLGETFGRKAVPRELMTKIDSGVFDIVLPKAPEELIHALVYAPNPGEKLRSFNLLIPAGECDFQVEFDMKKPGNSPIFTNSTENNLYWAYTKQLKSLLETRDNSNNDFRLMEDVGSLKALEEAEKAVLDYQKIFLAEHPNSAWAKLSGLWLFKIPPVQSTTASAEEAAVFRQNWFRKHLLEGIDISTKSFWRSPVALDLLDQFTFKTAMPSPDSVVWHVDEVFQRLSSNPPAQHYYLNYILNSLEKMSRFQFDEAFVRVVDDYVRTQKTDGYDQSAREEKYVVAERINRLKIGKVAPEVTLFAADGTPVALKDVQARYLFMMFFMPDCSHCKKDAPKVKLMAEKYKGKDLKVVLVCGKPGDNLADCFDFPDKLALPADWLVLADGRNKSKFRTLYNLEGFPRLFLLDENKKILARRGGSISDAEMEKMFSDFIR